jgi:hypothetical protein
MVRLRVGTVQGSSCTGDVGEVMRWAGADWVLMNADEIIKIDMDGP